MLLDLNEFGIPPDGLSGIDLYTSLKNDQVVVFEKNRTVNDVECVVVGNWNFTACLAKKYDYLPIRRYYFSFVSDDSGARPIERYVDKKYELTDINDYGNGIWLPSNVLETRYDSEGNVRRITKIDYSYIKVNSGIADDFFDNFFPENVHVADTVSDLVYKWGERASINGLLQETAKSKRSFFFQYLSLTVGFALIILFFILKYMAYLKEKKAA